MVYYANIPFLNGDREFFRVDEFRYLKEPIDRSWTIAQVVKAPLQLLKAIFISFLQAIQKNGSFIKTSFKLTVLGKYEDKIRISFSLWVMALKVLLWVGQVSFNVLTTTVRLSFDKLRDPDSNSAYVANFSGEEIDVSHLRSNDIEIDTSQVSEEVSLDSLLGIFDEIPPDMSKEGGTRESLELFINRVKGRVAFLGTPPAHDAPRLCAFYQQVEDAIRFCLQNAQDAEDRYRIAINLAVAGESCGARYMGESMELYYRYSGIRDTGVFNLEDVLIELLAEKRLEIAKHQIYLRFDRDGQGVDTHDYNNYMSSLGGLLGLPGSKNIVEHLANPLPKAEYLNYFFAEYTPDVIINTVQEKYQSSQAFREKIYTWIKGYAEEYEPPEVEVDDDRLKQIQEIRDGEINEKEPLLLAAKHLQEIIESFKSSDESFTTIEDLLSSPKVKTYLEQQYLDRLNRAVAQQSIKRLFHGLPTELRKVLLSPASVAQEDLSHLVDETVMRIKAEKICSLFDADIDIKEVLLLLQPIYQDEALGKVVSKVLQKAREDQDGETLFFEEFSSHLYNEDEEKNLLSRELVEWLLVSHHILRPQVVEEGV